MRHPVVLVHGWGGSFDTTWKQSGFADLLEDAGRAVIGVDLLGHGVAPKPHDPEAYADLTARVLEAAPDEPCDFVGFSLGAMTLLRLAIDHPARVKSLVLAGIGRNVLEGSNTPAHRSIVRALRSADTSAGVIDDAESGPMDNVARLFVQYASGPGNDRAALTAILEHERPPFTADELSGVRCPVLIVIGSADFAGPGEPLQELLPDARLVSLPRVDHFATPENFGFFDATLDFLGAAL